MRRLCDSLTKSDDDKADTSRMDDNDKKIVEMDDKDEMETLKAQVNSDGHKPRKGGHEYQQDHTGTWNGV